IEFASFLPIEADGSIASIAPSAAAAIRRRIATIGEALAASHADSPAPIAPPLPTSGPGIRAGPAQSALNAAKQTSIAHPTIRDGKINHRQPRNNAMLTVSQPASN